MLFNELPFLERVDAAAKAGFRGVEFKYPYPFPKDEVLDAARKNDLEIALFNVPCGDWDAGDRGLGCQPHRIKELHRGIDLALEYADYLGVDKLNLLGGIPPKKYSKKKIRKTFIKNLKYATKLARPAGIKIVIEPVNTYDSPGVFLTRTDQAVDILHEVEAENLGIELDLYQTQLMEGDLTNCLKKYIQYIWHMQVADVPTRAEPGTGEINYDFIFRVIQDLDYKGWIGCDYQPTTTTLEGLGWLNKWDPMIGNTAKKGKKNA